MPKQVQVVDYLAVDELERRYREAKVGIERSHYQIIWFLAQGRSPADVSVLTSYSRDRIYKLLRSYNEQGPSALGDQRRHNPGQAPCWMRCNRLNSGKLFKRRLEMETCGMVLKWLAG